MLNVRASFILFSVGAVLLLMSPLILSRAGQVAFAGAGAVMIVFGVYVKQRKRGS